MNTLRRATAARFARKHPRSLDRRFALVLLAAVPFASIVSTPRAASAQALDPDNLLSHVKYLASDELAGREAGEPGADRAAEYVAQRFESAGLEPLGTGGYLQPFEITTTIRVAEDSRLILETPDGRQVLELGVDWMPFNFSSAGEVSGRAFRAGYGLTNEDYAGADSPKIVVLRGGVPDGFDFHGSGIDPSPRRKATMARERGAEAVLISVSQLELPRPGDPPHALGVPAIQVVDRPEIRAALRGDEPVTVTLDANVEPLKATPYNVVGMLEGSDPVLSQEIIVVGAHYDHLGLGGPGSLAPEVEAPHNGADDNASGTAVLLGLARHFAETGAPARSLVFVAFSAEEMGLLGSDFFVSHPPFELDRVTAMINFDMVGRLRDGEMQVFGTESAEEFEALLDTLDARDPELKLSYVGDGYGPSDQTSFYARDIPVLHLFTGTHSEYHRPEDDWQLINAQGMAEVAEFASTLVRDLADRSAELTLVKRERPQAGGGGGYGPYLGTVPDFGEVEGGGLRLSGVRSGSPAEQAGLQPGDVVIEFGGREVLNIYDYTYALRDHAPGDSVTIKVRRDGEVLELTAVLGRRN
ncbi:MAG: M28 family peptidase [Gemmatimonadetes bacterium]|uniref:M28 family peptidase n=1 Tax=Candidatus Kutchimonas denitrificans TaxID=3056748 RepID=A0AAE5CBT7_9BACT|nr:M28 family peptidase [Gemmatimonadota bacterium]NIR74958.1 M28 family peptidase [Candidatus Kutchimonas denitrificans]NIS00070.1 M28 family peptidase [Gemmatimonadota bacterium]NIT65653.1 M28 family peptidase [Gemmatimonadota bacterium]NIU52623.1 M28 family peptidase [Gemmatimonadota bacterium]